MGSRPFLANPLDERVLGGQAGGIDSRTRLDRKNSYQFYR
jgi:hypothetical protein